MSSPFDFSEDRLANSLKMIEAGKQRTGRQYGDCSMCCKILLITVPELSKPAGEWCKHCRPGKGGCSIYKTRPDICKGFACMWLVDPDFTEDWKPTRAKIVVPRSGRKRGLTTSTSMLIPRFRNGGAMNLIQRHPTGLLQRSQCHRWRSIQNLCRDPRPADPDSAQERDRRHRPAAPGRQYRRCVGMGDRKVQNPRNMRASSSTKRRR